MVLDTRVDTGLGLSRPHTWPEGTGSDQDCSANGQCFINELTIYNNNRLFQKLKERSSGVSTKISYRVGPGRRAQQMKALVDKSDDPSLTPKAHMAGENQLLRAVLVTIHALQHTRVHTD